MHPLARRDDILLAHGPQAVRLRPSLRAAIQLERLHDGWPGLLMKLEELDTTTLRAIIRTAATDWRDAEAFLHALAELPLVEIRAILLEPLGALLALFLAPTSDEAPAIRSTAKPLAWDRAYAELFKCGTAILGWSPAETWAATPTEIAQALDAKITHLNAMNGVAPSDRSDALTAEAHAAKLREIEELGHDPDFDREAYAELRARFGR